MGHVYPWYLVVYERDHGHGGIVRNTDRYDRLADAQRRFDEVMYEVKNQPLLSFEDRFESGIRTLNVELFGCDCIASCRPDSTPNAPLQTSPETR